MSVESLTLAAGGWVLNYFAARIYLDDDTSMPFRQTAAYASVIGISALAYLSLGMYNAFLSYAVGFVIWFAIAARHG